MFPSQLENLIMASKKKDFSQENDLANVGADVSMHTIPQYQGMLGAKPPVEINPGFQDSRNLRFGIMPSDDFHTSIITPR